MAKLKKFKCSFTYKTTFEARDAKEAKEMLETELIDERRMYLDNEEVENVVIKEVE